LPSAAPVQVNCPAKLNLFLEILGKRPDGYHEIETVIVPAPSVLFDRIEAAFTPGGTVTLELRLLPLPEDPFVPGGEENLAVRAARLVLAEAGSKEGVRLTLTKNIPAGAGLGGGSSDAAGALRAVNRLLGDPLAEERLSALGLSLGSDVPYFLRGGAVLARGRGEVLESIPWDPVFRFIVVCPGFPVSTREAYRKCCVPDPKKRRSPRPVLEALAGGDAEALSKACFNRLEEAGRESEPRLATALDRWRSMGIGPIHMSGSGSSCFLLLTRRTRGRTLLVRIEEGLSGMSDRSMIVSEA